MMANTDVKAQLTTYLKELHLPTIRACFEDQARRAQQ
jgi:DNA replication protein DnaC